MRQRFPPVQGKTTLERFAEKCAFDPITGCVMWIGGQTKGHGHHEPYGRFRDGTTWLAHRWSAHNIHGHDITNRQVDHCCPCGPSTLCVEHVNPETAKANRYLQHSRPGRAFQDLETRRYWVHVQVGLMTREPIERITEGIPWFTPPTWLIPFMPMEISDDCPF